MQPMRLRRAAEITTMLISCMAVKLCEEGLLEVGVWLYPNCSASFHASEQKAVHGEYSGIRQTGLLSPLDSRMQEVIMPQTAKDLLCLYWALSQDWGKWMINPKKFIWFCSPQGKYSTRECPCILHVSSPIMHTPSKCYKRCICLGAQKIPPLKIYHN